MKINKQKLKKSLLNVLYPVLSLGLVLAIWAIVAYVKGKPLIVPMPAQVLKNFFLLFGQGEFWTSFGWTLLRTLICFALAFVFAFLFGAISGVFPPFARVLSPVISILRAAPTMAVILIAMLWLNAQNAPILIGFLVAFPLLYQAIYTAITGIDKDLVEMTKVYKVSVWNRIVGLYVPEIAPTVFDASKSTLSLTLKVVIAGEVLAYTRDSIGHQMQTANLTFDMSMLLAWTIMAIVMSFVLEGIVALLKKLWGMKK